MQRKGDPVEISAVEAGKRVEAILREAHPQAAEIVLGQAAIERELRAIFAERCGTPSRHPKLKVVDRLLRKSCDDPWLGKVLDVAANLTRLRNAVAHGDTRAEVDRCADATLEAFSHVGPPVNSATVRFGMIAEGVAMALHVGFGDAG